MTVIPRPDLGEGVVEWRDDDWRPINTAPKDCRILAYGLIGFESEPGIGTVKWDRARPLRSLPSVATSANS
jgi:hypothetical protein